MSEEVISWKLYVTGQVHLYKERGFVLFFSLFCHGWDFTKSLIDLQG